MSFDEGSIAHIKTPEPMNPSSVGVAVNSRLDAMSEFQ